MRFARHRADVLVAFHNFFCSNRRLSASPPWRVGMTPNRVGVALHILSLFFALSTKCELQSQCSVLYFIRLLRCASMRGGCFYFTCISVLVRYTVTYASLLVHKSNRVPCVLPITLGLASYSPWRKGLQSVRIGWGSRLNHQMVHGSTRPETLNSKPQTPLIGFGVTGS